MASIHYLKNARNFRLRSWVLLLMLGMNCSVMADEVVIGNFLYKTVGLSSASVAAANREAISGEVIIPSSVEISGNTYNVTEIASNAFSNCNKMTGIDLPGTIKNIEYDSFAGCVGLTGIIIPKSVTYINDWAFYRCENLERIDVAEGNQNYKSIDGVLFSADGLLLCRYPGGKKDESYSIPEGVESIFSHCAFNGVGAIKSLTLPETFKMLAGDCFSNCSALEEVFLPESLIDMGGAAFGGCNNLRKIIVRSAHPVWLYGKMPFEKNTLAHATLYVPTGRTEYFRAAPVWEDFTNIEEMEMTGITIDSSPFKNITTKQTRLGYYQENDCYGTTSKTWKDYFGGSKAGTYKTCIRFTDKQMKAYVGNHISHLRFSLWNTAISNVRIWFAPSLDGEYLYSQEVGNLVAGWNEVTLNTPFEILGDTLFVGYEYEQAGSCYPISAENCDEETGVFYLRGPFGGNGENVWDDLGMKNEKLCLQLIMEGDHLPAYDISMAWVKGFQPFYKPGDDFRIMFQCRNWGKKNIAQYEYSYLIDDKEYSSQTQNYTPGDNYLYGNIAIDMPPGNHTLKVAIKSIHGETPLYTADDTLSIPLRVYLQDIGKQKVLLTNYTATWCPYSVRRNTEISNLLNTRNDIALVKIHDSDGLSCDASDFYCSQNQVIPAVYYDNFSSFEDASSNPAFATVNISSEYCEETRWLELCVKGNRNNDYEALVGNSKLTVLLTEDNLVMPQYNSETFRYIYDYEHDGVLRANVTALEGDPITWSNDEYEMKYHIRLNEGWNADNMKIVAFIGSLRKSTESPLIVNSNDFAVKDAVKVTAIRNIALPDSFNIYNLHGNMVRHNVSSTEGLKPGIYMANGKKLVVK